ncbi:MAG: alpha/beta hydrolase [Gammaproteobacteria bacterium]|nr:alpha/beta hydrolase [Gammaproteobacteria bacterium]
MQTDHVRPSSHSYFSHRLRLHYLDWGNNDAAPLLLIHGIHDHGRSWDWFAQSFQKDYHIIVPDLRGHGDSDWAIGSSYTLIDYVYDIAQLIRQLDLAPITIVSHSLGGTIAAIYSGLYPSLVDKLVIIEGVGLYPGLNTPNPSQKIRYWIDAGRSLSGRTVRKYPTIESAYQRMHETNPHLSTEQARHLSMHASNQNEDGTFSWKFDNYTRNPSPYEISHDDMVALWQSITARVLIINSADGYPHRIGQDGTNAHFRQRTEIEIQDAGHWAHHDQLDAVVKTTVSFLEGTID